MSMTHAVGSLNRPGGVVWWGTSAAVACVRNPALSWEDACALRIVVVYSIQRVTAHTWQELDRAAIAATSRRPPRESGRTTTNRTKMLRMMIILMVIRSKPNEHTNALRCNDGNSNTQWLPGSPRR
eukprot:936225-Prymnesium_polylepis.1